MIPLITNLEEYERGEVNSNTVEGFYSRLQARHERHFSSLRRTPFAPLPCGVRFPLSNRVRLGVDDIQRADRPRRALSESGLRIKRLITERPYGKNRKTKNEKDTNLKTH